MRKKSSIPENESSEDRKKRVRQEAMELLFGKNPQLKSGNIWGKSFTLISAIGLGIICLIILIGVLSGNIRLEEQMQKSKEMQVKANSSGVK
jgi:hypothetical protein